MHQGTLALHPCLPLNQPDDKQCFVPETVPVKWTLEVEAHDRERVPKELQKLK